MSLADLLPAIRALPADERRELARLLCDELPSGPPVEPAEQAGLAAEFFPPGLTLELWSPIQMDGAAEILAAMLAAERGGS